jgi:diguanylate cyclase (GGDEF)-like protein/PAS domain S-box-containing protein
VIEHEKQPTDAAVAECARAWAGAIAGLGRHPVDDLEVERWLGKLTGLLVRLLHSQSFSAGAAHDVGAALVRAGFADPDVVCRTIEVLGLHLSGLAGRRDGEFRIRVARTLGAVSAGFAGALQRRAQAGGSSGSGSGPQSGSDSGAQSGQQSGAQSGADSGAQSGDGRFRALFAGAAVGIGLCDPNGRLVETNRALAELLGHDTARLVGTDLLHLVHPDDAVEVREQVWLLLAEDTPDEVRLERRLVRADGEVLWALLALSLVRDEAGGPAGLAVMAQDVTDDHELRLELRHRAFHDPLTGLPNRALLAERIHRLFHTNNPTGTAGLCFLDLDGFKAVNDRLGHAAGDRLLADVAQRVDACVTADGHLLARVGGDEFVILVAADSPRGTAATLADRVLDALEFPFHVGRQELWISASIGVVERPVATTNPTDLLREADLTMHRAKANGKARRTLHEPEAAAATAAAAAWRPVGISWPS